MQRKHNLQSQNFNPCIMTKIILFAAMVFGIVMCNRTGSNQTVTYYKICRYNCKDILNCKDYFFEHIDSSTVDSFEHVAINGHSYISTSPKNYQILPFAKKDTLIFILND